MIEYDMQTVTENLKNLIRCLEQEGNERLRLFDDWDRLVEEARKPDTIRSAEFFRTYDGGINPQRRDFVREELRKLERQELIDPPVADPPLQLRQQLVEQFVVAEAADRVNMLVREGGLRPVQRDYVLEWLGSNRPDPCIDLDPDQTPWPFLPLPPPDLTWQLSFQPGTWTPYAIRDQSILADIANTAQTLTVDGNAQLRWSNQTALVRTLRGPALAPAPTNAPPTMDKEELQRRTREFYREHAPAFSASREVWVEAEDSIGRVVRLRQTSSDGIPVYGGVFIGSYNHEGNLTFTNNSSYPIPTDGFADRFPVTQVEAFDLAQEFVTALPYPGVENHGPEDRAKEPPKRELHVEPADTFLGGEDAGRVVLPTLLVDGQIVRPRDLTNRQKERVEQRYLPAWAIRVIDELNGQSWIVMVDAERTEGAIAERILYWSETTSGADIQATVFRTIAHATLVGLVPEQMKVGESPTNLLAAADSFQLVDKDGHPVPNPPPGQFSREANAYFHLAQALKWFSALVEQSWQDLPVGQLPLLPGAGTMPRVTVKFQDAAGGAKLTTGKNSSVLSIGRKDDGDSHAHPPRLPRGDPALDAEVLYHEFAHGVMHRLQPDLNNLILNSSFRRPINEGLAFYFACSMSDELVRAAGLAGVAGQLTPHRWAKLAYKDPGWTDTGLRDLERAGIQQKADSDYLQVYGVFPQFNEGLDDPDGEDYAVGMAWARTLWDIRRVLGPEIANAIILRSALLAGGVQADIETWAEAIIHVDGEWYTPSHRGALQAIFAARGLLADTPIRVIERVDLGGRSILLATVEGINNGCLVSLDNGITWQPLGVDGPGDAVALCCLPFSANKTIIYLATESWINRMAGQSGINVHSYVLQLDAQGNVVMDGTWSHLPFLNSAADVRCMVATAGQPGGSGPWLFVGAENGIYKHNGDLWQVTFAAGAPGQPPRAMPNVIWDSPILALKVGVIDGVRRLFAGTRTGLLDMDITPETTIGQPALIESQPLPPLDPGVKPVLCIETEEQGQNTTRIWLGTIGSGVRTLDLTVPAPAWTLVGDQWRRDGAVEPTPPVLHVRAIPAGGAPIVQAGTTSGVYVLAANGDWEAQTQGFSAGAENLENVSVLALAGVGNRLLVGTGQRGMWMHEGGGWARVEGLPRVGVRDDPRDPVCNCFRANLPRSGVGSHLIYVAAPQRQSLTLTLQVFGGAVQEVELFYVASAINLNKQQWAGVQDTTLVAMGGNQWRHQGPAPAGHYIVVLRADNQPTDYRLDVALA